jgi:1-acyl-sn-glycerol-3-phosphate acyltransferase
MLLLRSLLFAAAFYAMTAVMVIGGSPLLLAPRRLAMRGLKLHGRCALWLLRAIVGTEIEVRGRENIPKGAAIVAAKHQAAWDTFALIPLLGDPAMVMKAELGLIPFYGWFARKFEHILVARERGPAALRTMIAAASRRAEENRQIVIFPEGTRQPVNAAPDYKPGVVALYEGLNVPCVPVALNSGLFWPRRTLMRYPGTIVVEFLEPIPPGLERRVFRATLEARIEEATNRLVAEAKAARPVSTSSHQTSMTAVR